jgi:hypothetical protein
MLYLANFGMFLSNQADERAHNHRQKPSIEGFIPITSFRKADPAIGIDVRRST